MPARRLIVLVFALAACNYDWTYRPPADGGSNPAQKDGGNTSSSGGSSGDPGAVTSCSFQKPCSAGQYCYFPDRQCGTKDPNGECREPGIDCKDAVVCTCKQTTSNGCTAQKEGIDIDETGASCSGASTFPCGEQTCVTGKEACVSSGGAFKCSACTDGCKCVGFETCTCDDSTFGQVIFKCN